MWSIVLFSSITKYQFDHFVPPMTLYIYIYIYDNDEQYVHDVSFHHHHPFVHMGFPAYFAYIKKKTYTVENTWYWKIKDPPFWCNGLQFSFLQRRHTRMESIRFVWLVSDPYETIKANTVDIVILLLKHLYVQLLPHCQLLSFSLFVFRLIIYFCSLLETVRVHFHLQCTNMILYGNVAYSFRLCVEPASSEIIAGHHLLSVHFVLIVFHCKSLFRL